MGADRPPAWILLKAHLQADPKKTVVLVVLLVVMGVVYARWWLEASPSRSTAAESGVVATLSTGTVPGHRDAAADRREVPASAVPRALVRDPFAVDAGAYPSVVVPDGPEPVGGTEVPVVGTFARIKAAAEKLVLKCTLSGDSGRPIACINGQYVGPGDRVTGFEVVTVEPGRVVVRQGGFQFALRLE